MNKPILVSLLLASTVAYAQPALRRVATYGDPEPTLAGATLTRPLDPVIGADGFIAYFSHAQAFGTPHRVFRTDDGGIQETIAYTNQGFDGLTLGTLNPPVSVAGTMVLFEASASPEPALLTWDPSRGLHKVITMNTALPGGGVVESLDGALVNPSGQVVFHSTSSTATGQHVLVEADGTIRTILRIGQAVPGFAAFNVVVFGATYLADSGAVTVQVTASNGTTAHTFILHGAPGALTVVASTTALPGPTQRRLTLVGASPSGQIAFITFNDDGTTNGRTEEIHVGAPGATTVVSSLSGQAAQPLVGSAHSFRIGAFLTGLLADGNELALIGVLERGGVTTQGVAVHHDGVWSLVLAGDEQLSGQQVNSVTLNGINPSGQVLVTAATTDESLWRHTHGVLIERIAQVGLPYDVGQPSFQTATQVFAVLGAQTPIADDGSVVFLVGWLDSDDNLATTVFTTATATADLDVGADVQEQDDFETIRVEFAVGNNGPATTGFQLLITLDSALPPPDGCTDTFPTMICASDVLLPANDSTVVTLIFEGLDIGFLVMGTVEVLPLTAVDPVDDNNTDSFELLTSIHGNGVEEGACGKCNAPGCQGRNNAVGNSAGLLMVGLVLFRRRRR